MSVKEMKRKARAFVLIETDPGKEKEVMEKLLKFDQVKEVQEIQDTETIIPTYSKTKWVERA